MTTTTALQSAIHPSWPSFNRTHNLVSGLAALALALMWFAGYGPGGTACKAPTAPIVSSPITLAPVATPEPPAPIAAVPVPAPEPPAPVAVAAPAVVAASPAPAQSADVPAARVYFELDRTNVPADVDKSLTEVIAYLTANPGSKAFISGFHDPTGNRAHNTDLALNRARNIRTVLQKAGIAEDRITMQRPQETTGTGSLAEARRVEVTIAP
jgi:outer membrane protein OmpA-like peptidoglycan-associated protein